MTQRDRKNALEWAVFIVSLVMTLAIVAYLGYEAVTHRDAPPSVSASLGSPEPEGQGVRVPVLVHNRGPTAARAVIVEVRVSDRHDAAPVQIEIDRIPPNSTREGWVVLSVPPTEAAHACAEVLGFEKP